jgi:hypothetical protein
MKISEITINDLKDYARVDHIEDDTLFNAILIACKSYISNYTGLPLLDDPSTTDVVENNCDAHEDLTIALFILSNELYDNRSFTVQDNKVNVVIKSILDMHSINLL